MSTPKTAPDFGEPWIDSATWDQLHTQDGKVIVYNASDMNEPYRSRAIACVTACSGLSDPAAEIQALREAFDAAKAFIDCHVSDPDITSEMVEKYAAYQSALSKLQPLA